MNHIACLKNANQDFEYYPTTNEILEKLAQRLNEEKKDYWDREKESFLDIGAGTGKVLDFVSKEVDTIDHYYAVEKSEINLSNLNSNYQILGVDFHKVTLIDKFADFVFCNPPYSEYEQWAEKIIREVNNESKTFLVIPRRWENSRLIQDALKLREAEAKILGEFDFEDSEDRTARAKVHLLEIIFKKHNKTAFDVFFDENFSYPEPAPKFEDKGRENNEGMVKGKNLIETLCELHDARLKKIHQNYQNICELDYDLLQEFEISRKGLIESLNNKLANLRKHCWEELFKGLKSINKTLTVKSRKKIVEVMNRHTGIEFNVENAYAVVMWVVKNANKYYDDQFVETYNEFMDLANVETYKSNQRVFEHDRFGYSNFYSAYVHRHDEEKTEKYSHFRFKIGNRIVAACSGGLRKTGFHYDSGLQERGQNLIADLQVIAHNLGFFPTSNDEPATPQDWTSGNQITYNCTHKQKEKPLFQVRAYYNGNMHFKFLPEFIHACNIYHGKLKGWINSPQEAEEELLTKEEKNKNPQLKSLTSEVFAFNIVTSKQELLLTL